MADLVHRRGVREEPAYIGGVVISRTAKQSSQGNVHRGHCARAYRRSSSVRSCFSKISFPTVDAINQGVILEGLEGVPHPRLDRQNGRRLILLVQPSGIKGAPAVSSGAREVSGRGRGTVWRRLVCDRDHSGSPVSRPSSRCRVESRSKKRAPPVAGLSSIAARVVDTAAGGGYSVEIKVPSARRQPPSGHPQRSCRH